MGGELVGITVQPDGGDELLQAGRLDGDPGVGSAATVGLGEVAADGRRDDPAQPPSGEQLASFGEGQDVGLESPGDEGTAPGLVDVGLQDDPAAVEHQHLLHELGRFVDEVRRHDEGAGRGCGLGLVGRGIRGEQLVVEDAARGRVETEVGLVEEGRRLGLTIEEIVALVTKERG